MRKTDQFGKIPEATGQVIKNHSFLVKSDDTIQVDGVITQALPNTTFRVQLDEDSPQDLSGQTILCTLSGKMRLYRIKVMPGDKVKCEVSRYDTTKGRITFREK